MEYGWLHSSVVQNLADGLRANVTEANVTHQTFLVKGLAGLPSLLVSHTGVEDHLAVRSTTVESCIEVLPLRWVCCFKWDECKSDWEVNQVQINVVKSKVREGPHASWFDMLWPMERVPQFADHKEVLSRADAFIEGAFDAQADFFLVAIVTSIIEESVAILDSVIHDISADVLGHFPEAKAELGQFVARG